MCIVIFILLSKIHPDYFGLLRANLSVNRCPPSKGTDFFTNHNLNVLVRIEFGKGASSQPLKLKPLIELQLKMQIRENSPSLGGKSVIDYLADVQG